ncbi:hypothetical protein PG995_011432 [Apiospora arundinis]
MAPSLAHDDQQPLDPRPSTLDPDLPSLTRRHEPHSRDEVAVIAARQVADLEADPRPRGLLQAAEEDIAHHGQDVQPVVVGPVLVHGPSQLFHPIGDVAADNQGVLPLLLLPVRAVIVLGMEVQFARDLFHELAVAGALFAGLWGLRFQNLLVFLVFLVIRLLKRRLVRLWPQSPEASPFRLTRLFVER